MQGTQAAAFCDLVEIHGGALGRWRVGNMRVIEESMFDCEI